LSIDLEEWYHPQYVKGTAGGNKKERLTNSLNETLNLLNEYKVNATFFVIGEIAERRSELIEKIRKNGHEIGFHGYHHETLSKLNVETFQHEIEQFKVLVKEKCLGFRAPSFSLDNRTKWALKVLENTGFKYDSSVFPTRTFLYGVPRAPIRPYKPSCENVAEEDEGAKLWEFPLLVYPLAGFRIPIAGGFYLRFLPLDLMKGAINRMNKHGFPAVIYVHNWELDVGTPKLGLGLYKSFVTYYNIKEARRRLSHLLSNFRFTSFRNYMEKIGLN
jgi:polysaccharide deacetylase family protein (PEP-CTERM system associated)